MPIIGGGLEEKLTVNASARADLVLPLSGHDLGVGARDLNTSVQAGLVVSLDNVSAEDLAGTVTAVVGTLRSGVAVPGPAVGPAVGVEEGVLLLKTEPELLVGVGLHQEGGIVAEVESVGGAVGHPGLAHDEDVVAESPGIGVVGDGAEVDIGVVAGGLAS
jgi:hypothetical protein